MQFAIHVLVTEDFLCFVVLCSFLRDGVFSSHLCNDRGLPGGAVVKNPHAKQ